MAKGVNCSVVGTPPGPGAATSALAGADAAETLVEPVVALAGSAGAGGGVGVAAGWGKRKRIGAGAVCAAGLAVAVGVAVGVGAGVALGAGRVRTGRPPVVVWAARPVKLVLETAANITRRKPVESLVMIPSLA